jgi:hypothetical protein
VGHGAADGAAECALSDVLDGVVNGESQARSVSSRLELKFGLGQCPQKRRELYRRLELLHKKEGDRVQQIISEAVAQAVGARDPGRYFCKCVVAKLREAGFGLGAAGGGDPSW